MRLNPRLVADYRSNALIALAYIAFYRDFLILDDPIRVGEAVHDLLAKGVLGPIACCLPWLGAELFVLK